MANMSYCKFQNTLTDFNDCLNVVREAVYDDMPFEEFAEYMGSDELKAMLDLYARAKRFVEMVDQLSDK
jgi:hypothetical protein